MRPSPPLKAKLLYDDHYELKPSPILSAQTAPLLRDTIVVDSGAGEDAAPDLGEVSLSERLCGACASESGYLARMGENFGWRYLAALTSVYLGVKGILIQLVTLAMLPYYRQAGVSPRQFQQYDVVTKTPWALKAWFGAMSDLYPLMGYHKRSYMTAVSVVGALSCGLLAVATTVPSVWTSGAAIASIPGITLEFVGVNLQGAVVDLLAEGSYTKAMADKPWSGSDLVSWVWACVQGGQFVAAAAVGMAADSHCIHLLFPVAAAIATQVILFSELGWFGDRRLPVGERGLQVAKYRANRRVFLLAGAMASTGLGLAACNLLDASWPIVLALSLVSSTALCALAFWALPLVLAKCNLYLYLCSVLYVNISAAVDYYYVAGPDCVADGPHFSFR